MTAGRPQSRSNFGTDDRLWLGNGRVSTYAWTVASRIPVEELDLSIRAYNVLKANDVNFVDEIRPYLDASVHPLAPTNPNLERVRGEIEDRLRRWNDDSGEAGAPVPR